VTVGPKVVIYTINVSAVRYTATLRKYKGDDIFTISIKDILEY